MLTLIFAPVFMLNSSAFLKMVLPLLKKQLRLAFLNLRASALSID
jgi:hypothetical protein